MYHCGGANLPFHNGFFDFVLMVTTICFLDDPVAALRECHRVVRCGGDIIIGFVDEESEIGQQYRNHASRSLFYRDALFYSVDAMHRLLSDAGFEVNSISQVLFGPLEGIHAPQVVRDGSGDGSFVVLRAKRH